MVDTARDGKAQPWITGSAFPIDSHAPTLQTYPMQMQPSFPPGDVDPSTPRQRLVSTLTYGAFVAFVAALPAIGRAKGEPDAFKAAVVIAAINLLVVTASAKLLRSAAHGLRAFQAAATRGLLVRLGLFLLLWSAGTYKVARALALHTHLHSLAAVTLATFTVVYGVVLATLLTRYFVLMREGFGSAHRFSFLVGSVACAGACVASLAVLAQMGRAVVHVSPRFRGGLSDLLTLVLAAVCVFRAPVLKREFWLGAGLATSGALTLGGCTLAFSVPARVFAACAPFYSECFGALTR